MPSEAVKSTAPLADRMRPRNFDEFFGQEEIVGKDKLLRRLIESDQLTSIIFWGPPGSGKTTLAQIIAGATGAEFYSISAVMSGKEDLKKIIEKARVNAAYLPLSRRDPSFSGPEGEKQRGWESRRTILFIDEIHRWNKAQQDALLPYVEKGLVTLIGATTENPSFEIIGALLSRSRVFVLKHLSKDDVGKIIRQALADKDRGLGAIKIEIDDEAVDLLADLSGGDARTALNGLELAVKAKNNRGKNSPPLTKRGTKGESKPPSPSPYQEPVPHSMREEGRGEVKDDVQVSPPLTKRGIKGESAIVITNADIKEALQRTHLIFDKKGEEFYNLISALHKSMRGSDADAALYWLARMLEGGADPLYVARRVLRFASEDIGMANGEAMIQANAAYDACHKIGYPECTVHLAQAVVYCAKSKKSNLLYTAYNAAAEDARATSHLGVPLHLRNAPTKFMKEIGYGKDYKYNPNFDGPVEQDYLPEELKGNKYL